AMMDVILVGMRRSIVEEFTTIHNYIDTDSMILRKGSVSAQQGEKLLIPINMRDGSLICIGKGNSDWNSSAPHGAGRLMSRSAAFKQLSMEQYEVEMSGVYSTCILPDTLDESPMAYKPMDEIVENISPTAEIIAKIKPVYNFKAAENSRRRTRR
ncbi:MAG: RtcB family protein, partial [Oscillospiraceae bacterium]|nr:RtcB family protein [Oscillospiraceae bacterium]